MALYYIVYVDFMEFMLLAILFQIKTKLFLVYCVGLFCVHCAFYTVHLLGAAVSAVSYTHLTLPTNREV